MAAALFQKMGVSNHHDWATFQYIVFVALFGFGAWLLYASRDFIRLGLASYRWPKTTGTIVNKYDTSFTIPGVGMNNTTVGMVECRETTHVYEYEVWGKIYRCHTYCFGAYAETSMAAYLSGAEVQLYYDPNHPEVAVLRRGLQPGAIFGIIPMAGAFLLLFLL